METPDGGILLALLALLVAVVLLIGRWRRYVLQERGRSTRRRRRILDRWHAQPPNEHNATGGNDRS